MQQVTWFVWKRVPSLLIAIPLICASYVMLYGLMLLTQGPMPIMIEITGGTHSGSRFQSEPERQAWQKEKLRENQKWQLQVSYGLSEERSERFAKWMGHASDQTGVPFPILASVIATESSFRYQAVSWAGAVGPAQVIPRFWQDTLCTGNLLDPAENILCGAKVLMKYHTRYCQREWVCTLSHYNVGPGNLRSGDLYYQEAAERYVNKVTSRLSEMQYF